MLLGSWVLGNGFGSLILADYEGRLNIDELNCELKEDQQKKLQNEV